MLNTAWVVLNILCLPGFISSQEKLEEEDICARSSCYPATGDLLVGRGDRLYASSTCGLNGGPERFCIISNLKERHNCKTCDSREGVPEFYRHVPKFMVILFKDERKDTWWQSENGKENVYLQLDFEAQFYVTHIVMKWHSFRPAAMLIERSYDNGTTWRVARYYAKDCATSFPGVPVATAAPDNDISLVYCTSEYSYIEPSSGGEVVYKALSANIDDDKAWTSEVQNLLRMTNLRINFTKLNTLGDDILDNSPETNRKYYYAVNWISIRGSCSCYGHAKECLPQPGAKDVQGMVHSVCNCTHNTAGLNCDVCKEGYHDRPWKPATKENPNECKKCECHGHSDKCVFDPAVWAASGETSGGKCLDCQHNTIGTKCEKCKPLHYQDPSLSIRDPDVCRPCDCDPAGSVGRGECQMEEDPVQNLRAGECICKEHVEGKRCDRCKEGFFNMTVENLDGCDPCGCDVQGSIGKSCDAYTGRCLCKRYVHGDKCDKCLDGYWGLQSGRGCKPCECDPGGAYNNLCDIVTGQCPCRPGIEGRKCDRVIPGYYFSLSDNLKYEGEEARGIGVTSVHLLERPKGRKIVWTDVGSLNITEGNGVEFSVTNVPMTGNYKLLMRFYPKTISFWEEVKVTVSRADGQRSVNGACGNALTSNGYSFITSLREYKQTKLFNEMICLEKGVHYYVRVDFNRQQGRENRINLDSLVLIPDVSSVSIFQGGSGRSRLRNFERYRCESPNLPASVPRPSAHPVCRRLHFSGSAVIYDGAIPCDCDETGTYENISGIYVCKDAGGQCPCKPNVIGRRCRKCAPGTYKFGPNGCSPCACDLRGSYGNLCDVVTGQCTCNGLGIGRQCNRCKPRQWGFPQCRPCDCNRHAGSCDPVSGVCIDCLHNTAGDHCEICKPGYFGDATKGTTTDCKKCQCPGGSSENQFSPTCKVDDSTSPPSFICDNCPPGYQGNQCEECSDGFYGNPLIPGGKCEKCNCSGNVNLNAGGGCDKRTGECRGCLHNTTGYFCHVCRRGYYGNAKNRTCQPCKCDQKGTDLAAGACNVTSGQCPCKSNVVGISCDRCAPGHWDLDSGDGCKSCDCCPLGATTSQCDQETGVCSCRRDFGGSKCCDCQDGFWGIPPGQCKPCDCNPSGSIHAQCDRQTGSCVCRPGVSGKKCNKCEPDTTREFPECDACHPCYYSWEKIISDLEKIASKIEVPSNRPGVFVDYDKELDALDELVRRIRYILGNRTTFPKHVEDIQDRVTKYRVKIMELMNIISNVHGNLTQTKSRVNSSNHEIAKLRAVYERLRVLVDDRLRNVTAPKSSYRFSSESFEKSTEAQNLSANILRIIEESRKYRLDVDKKRPGYHEKERDILKKIERYSDEYGTLQDIVDRVNVLLCGEACGGCNSTGCAVCGGEGCRGAVPLANKALETAQVAEGVLREKERKANATLKDVKEAEIIVNTALDEAKLALELVKRIQVTSSNGSEFLSRFVEEIHKILNRTGVDPGEVRRIAEFVLGRNFNFSEEEIRDLAKRITDAVNNLKGIDALLNETVQDLLLLEDLKREAIKANSSASQAAETAEQVTAFLKEVRQAHDKLKKLLKSVTRKVNAVQSRLTLIESELDEALNRSRASVRTAESMERRLVPLKEKFEENERMLNASETLVQDAVLISNRSKTESKQLKRKFDEVNKLFNDKLEEQKAFRERTERALSSAQEVKSSLVRKLKSLEGYLKRRTELDSLIDELKKLEKRVEEKFCEIIYDRNALNGCVRGAARPPTRPSTFCDTISGGY